MIVETTTGRVQGRRDEATGVWSFLGIPYAEPPVGPRRFRAPVAVAPWDGVRDATSFGPASAQVFDPLEAHIEDLGGVPSDPPPVHVGSEDSLTVNIWTPGADGAKRPVIVYIHGGANWLESSRVPVYHGDRFAARGDVVFASLNYRLGFFGFLELGGLDPSRTGSGINGLRDQLLALNWLAANVAAFGGDPANITVMGESAGSVDTSWLVGSGALDGLVRRAVLMSGVGTVSADPARQGADAAESRRIADLLLAEAGIGSMAELAAMPTAEVLARHAALLPRHHMLEIDSWFYPRRDDGLLARSPWDWAASPASAAIDVMVGTTAYEMGLWLLWDENLDTRGFGDNLRFLGDAGEAAGVDLQRAYEAAFPEVTEGIRGMHLLSDAVFVMPSVLLAERRAAAGGRSFVYQFAWEIPGSPMGAAHATDLCFAFDKMDTAMSREMFTPPTDPADEARRQRLAFAFQDAIVAFARHGHPDGATGRVLPDWPAWESGRRAVMRLDLESEVLDDPYRGRREAWMPLLERAIRG